MNTGAARFGAYSKVKYYQVEGLCNGSDDPDLWFSDTPDQLPGKRGHVGVEKKRQMIVRTIAAISICEACPAKQACLAEGMKPQNIDFGVWGGTLPGERLILAGRSPRSTEVANRVAFAKQVREAERLLLGEALS